MDPVRGVPPIHGGVTEIRQISDTDTHWKTEIAGVKREFDAKITEQLPDERVAWTSTGGTKQSGVITFHRLDENHTRVTAQMEFEPEASRSRPATSWASSTAGSRAT